MRPLSRIADATVPGAGQTSGGNGNSIKTLPGFEYMILFRVDVSSKDCIAGQVGKYPQLSVNAADGD